MGIRQLDYKDIDQKLREKRARATMLSLRNVVANPGIPESQRTKTLEHMNRIQKWVKGEL